MSKQNPTSNQEHGTGHCQDLLAQISDYIDGELEEELCAALETHLADCHNCRVMVDTVQKTITLYRRQANSELPSDVQDRLYKVLKLG
jgi:anti-sigma factor (TIGR02949 family)